jgi:hypothetical protein
LTAHAKNNNEHKLDTINELRATQISINSVASDEDGSRCDEQNYNLSFERGTESEQQTNNEAPSNDASLGDVHAESQHQQTLAQTIKILDNNLNNKAALNAHASRLHLNQ